MHLRYLSFFSILVILISSGDLLSTQFGIRKQQWYATDWHQIDESLIKLKNCGIKLIYPGHGRRAIRLGELEQLLL